MKIFHVDLKSRFASGIATKKEKRTAHRGKSAGSCANVPTSPLALYLAVVLMLKLFFNREVAFFLIKQIKCAVIKPLICSEHEVSCLSLNE